MENKNVMPRPVIKYPGGKVEYCSVDHICYAAS